MTDDVEQPGMTPAPGVDEGTGEATETLPEAPASPIGVAAGDPATSSTDAPDVAPANAAGDPPEPTAKGASTTPTDADADDDADDTTKISTPAPLPPPPPPPFAGWAPPTAPGATTTDPTAPTEPTPPTEPVAPPARPGWPFPVVVPSTPSGDATPPFGSPGASSFPPPPTDAGATPAPKEKKGRRWVAVAVIAAVVGALVGSGVTAFAERNNNGGQSVTIHESNSAPGAAVLSGNVTIPELVKKVIPAVVSIDVKAGGEEDEGTGMIITTGGEVITNNHVIELFTGTSGGSITVTEYGQTKALPATLIGYDATKDVALLKINNVSSLKTVTFGSSAKTQVGDAVVAIGNALGLAAGTPTVTQGIVSALGRSVTAGGTGTASENLQNLIQTDAAINPGNSGGPLIDTAGQVIGMNTAVAGSSGDGTNSQNIGFAIPISSVEALIPELEKGGPAANSGGYLGVDITTLTPALRQQYGFTPSTGAVILDVISGSPADKAGLKQGDVIVNIDGTAINSSETLQSVIQKSKAGQSVSITYYVGDEKHTVSVVLGTQAEEQQQANQQQSGSSINPFGGGGLPGSSGSTGSTGNTGGGTQLVP
jgi:S1-C subfamily serine protease